VAHPAKGTGGYRIGPWQPEERHARTGADGRADLPLAEGETLVVELTTWELRSAAVTSRGEPVTLRATREGTQYLLALDGEGRPAPRTLVWAEGAARATAMTADDGKLALAAPLHDLRLELEGAGGAWASARVTGGREGLHWPVDLEPPVVSTGRVLDGVTRAPVAGAVVFCHEAALPRWAATGSDGRFRLPVLHPARCQLEVLAPEYFPLHRGEPLAAGATLLLDRAATLAGLVVDPAGAPVSGAELWATSRTELWPGGWPRAWTDSQGRFRFTHLPARAAGVVLASRDGYRSSETAIVTPAPGEAARPLRLVLEPGEAVAVGRMVGPGGAPLEGVSVRLVGGSANRRTRSDPDGRFRFAALAPGSYRLLAELPGFGPVERELVAGPQADWGTLELEPAVTLAGRVTDGDGRPLERALVFLVPARKGVPHFDRTAAVRTDADGRFRFADLTRGERYAVAVTLTGYAAVELEEVEVPRAEPLVVVLPRP
jgi:protocatechuate 3,4-dioxygenase beta subunit